MSANSLDKLFEEALQDPDIRVAKAENALRRILGAAFEQACRQKQLSIRDLAREMSTSKSQVQRVLNKEQAGSLTLTTICKAADILDLKITLYAEPYEQAYSKVDFRIEDAYNFKSEERFPTRRLVQNEPFVSTEDLSLSEQEWKQVAGSSKPRRAAA